jgi:hypothetical protein
MKLIDNWQSSWKFWSSAAAILAGAFNAAVLANFYGLLDSLGPQWLAAINMVVGIVVIPLLRALKQTADENAEVPAPKQGGFIQPTLLIVMLTTAMLVACAGMPGPKTFEDSLAIGVTSVTQVRKTAEILLTAKKISKADAENVQQQADNAREAIALAIAIRTADPAAAQTKLTTAIEVLRALDRYLASKGTT